MNEPVTAATDVLLRRQCGYLAYRLSTLRGAERTSRRAAVALFVMLALGALLQRKGDAAAAIPELRAALRLEPSRPGAHQSLASLLGERGDRECHAQLSISHRHINT